MTRSKKITQHHADNNKNYSDKSERRNAFVEKEIRYRRRKHDAKTAPRRVGDTEIDGFERQRETIKANAVTSQRARRKKFLTETVR